MGWVGFTVIIMQVSVQIGLNWYWTGTELGNLFMIVSFGFVRLKMKELGLYCTMLLG